MTGYFEPEDDYVVVVRYVEVHYAYCPACGRRRKCHACRDGTFTLRCGCMCDGASKLEYFIKPTEVTTNCERRLYLERCD
jgi:hypothetical protein